VASTLHVGQQFVIADLRPAVTAGEILMLNRRSVNGRILFLLLTLCPPAILGTGVASAQDHEAAHSRVAADHLLQGGPVATSFDRLMSLLATGHDVVVTDHDGRRKRGKVVAISPEGIILKSPVAAGGWEAALPLYWPLDVGLVLKRHLAPAADRTFAAESLTRIDIVDPAGNGLAIGAVVGLSLVTVTYLWERSQPPSSLRGFETSLALVLGVPISLRMGYVIDRAINQPIFRKPRSSRVVIAPMVDRHSTGAAVVVRW
jgi:hypothetical protein